MTLGTESVFQNFFKCEGDAEDVKLQIMSAT